jgi:transposase-like protein
MDPRQQCRHHPDCSARGRVGQGTIGVHSQAEQRSVCHTCRRTFAATMGTACYRLRRAADQMTLVLTLLGHGCPPQAMGAAFGLDDRTVAAWRARAGTHGQAVHEPRVQQGQLDLPHVQADEWWVKRVGQRVWMALALAVPARLWLGGASSPHRDRVWIPGLEQQVRAGAGRLDLLVGVDGLASYVTTFRRVFHPPVDTGRRGRPRLGLGAGFRLGQVVKQYAKRRGVSVRQRAVQGTAGAIAAVLAATGTGHGIHTASIERLNATFRSALAPRVRRGRASAHQVDTLTAGRYLVGGTYHFCWTHGRLRRLAPVGAGRK